MQSEPTRFIIFMGLIPFVSYDAGIAFKKTHTIQQNLYQTYQFILGGNSILDLGYSPVLIFIE